MESTILYRISNEIECSKYLTIRSEQKGSSSVFIYDENEKKPICNHLHEKENLLQWLQYKKTQSDFVCPICNSDSKLQSNSNINMNINSSSMYIRDRNIIEPLVQLLQQGESNNIQIFSNGISSVPTGAVFAPNDNKSLYIIEQHGQVWRFDLEEKVRDLDPFFDISKIIKNIPKRKEEMTEFDDERGLLGFVFHPHYGNKTYPDFKDIFFAVYSKKSENPNYDHISVLSKFKRNPITKSIEEDIILEISQPQMNHNGGTILFGPPQEDSRNGIGYLYYGIGDGGGFNDQHGILLDKNDKDSFFGNAQNLTTYLGKILRIDVNVPFEFKDRATFKKYLIPKENPSELLKMILPMIPHLRQQPPQLSITQQQEMLPEIYAYGLRNPWKFSFDKNGRLFIADVGQDKIEEVNLIKAGSLLTNYGPNPLNFGWRALEGSVTFNSKVLEHIGGYQNTILPILEYDRTKFEGQSAIIGGYVYHGSEIPTLKGKYVFGDFNGKIFFGFETSLVDPTKWEMKKLISEEEDEQDIKKYRITSFAIDSMGELYVFKINTNTHKSGLYKFISLDLTKEEIDDIFQKTSTVAFETDSGIRAKLDGVAKCRMHISIFTLSGYFETYSMEDAWKGSIDISRSKAFTAAAFSSDQNALTSRTIGELSQTGPWNAKTTKKGSLDENRPPLYGIETSNPQYGIISFPGGIPIYKNEKLVGGLGVSGDIVDNDEKVAFDGLKKAEKVLNQFQPPKRIRIDTVSKGKWRYIKKT